MSRKKIPSKEALITALRAADGSPLIVLFVGLLMLFVVAIVAVLVAGIAGSVVGVFVAILFGVSAVVGLFILRRYPLPW